MYLEDVIYDILISINPKRKTTPSDSEIESVINNIPTNILSIGLTWGYNDTEFKDKVYEWLIK